MLVIYGMSTSTGKVAYQTTLQRAVPLQIRGRATAFFDVIWNATRLISLAAGALLTDTIDVRWVYLVAAARLIAAAAVGLTADTDVDHHQNANDATTS